METLTRPDSSARYLETLERLLEMAGADLATTLSQATDLVAAATGADKVDAFLYDPSRDSLVAVGTSNQPLSALQRKLGLDVLSLSNGGRVVHVYTTGATFVTGRLDEDVEELRGIKEALGIKSKLGVPLGVGGARRGMMMLASRKRDYFTPDDVRFAEAVARWTATAAHRAELVEAISRNAAEIVDQGPGIPAEMLPHLFDRFVTGMRANGGLGLGLCLAKEIAAMHGGELSVDSRRRQGARFILALPCRIET